VENREIPSRDQLRRFPYSFLEDQLHWPRTNDYEDSLEFVMLPLPHFDYSRPRNVKEAIHALSRGKRGTRVLAGGTDLLVQMKKGLVRPRLLVDIKHIRHISRISCKSKGELVLGAGVTLTDLEQWAKKRKDWSGLSMASGSIGSEQVRNRATVVGNLCRASPAGDMAPMLIALDGSVGISGPEGKRFVLVENFMTGPGKTVLTQGEMVISVRIPKIANSGAIYLRHGPRRAMDIAVIGVAVRLSLDETLKRIVCARIVLGAVAPIPMRVPEAEMILVESGVNLLTLQEVSNLAAARARPITDLRGTRSYRLEMVKVMTRRAVKQAWKQLKKKEVDR